MILGCPFRPTFYLVESCTIVHGRVRRVKERADGDEWLWATDRWSND